MADEHHRHEMEHAEQGRLNEQRLAFAGDSLQGGLDDAAESHFLDEGRQQAYEGEHRNHGPSRLLENTGGPKNRESRPFDQAVIDAHRGDKYQPAHRQCDDPSKIESGTADQRAYIAVMNYGEYRHDERID